MFTSGLGSRLGSCLGNTSVPNGVSNSSAILANIGTDEAQIMSNETIFGTNEEMLSSPAAVQELPGATVSQSSAYQVLESGGVISSPRTQSNAKKTNNGLKILGAIALIGGAYWVLTREQRR